MKYGRVHLFTTHRLCVICQKIREGERKISFVRIIVIIIIFLRRMRKLLDSNIKLKMMIRCPVHYITKREREDFIIFVSSPQLSMLHFFVSIHGGKVAITHHSIVLREWAFMSPTLPLLVTSIKSAIYHIDT